MNLTVVLIAAAGDEVTPETLYTWIVPDGVPISRAVELYQATCGFPGQIVISWHEEQDYDFSVVIRDRDSIKRLHYSRADAKAHELFSLQPGDEHEGGTVLRLFHAWTGPAAK